MKEELNIGDVVVCIKSFDQSALELDQIYTITHITARLTTGIAYVNVEEHGNTLFSMDRFVKLDGSYTSEVDYNKWD